MVTFAITETEISLNQFNSAAGPRDEETAVYRMVMWMFQWRRNITTNSNDMTDEYSKSGPPGWYGNILPRALSQPQGRKGSLRK